MGVAATPATDQRQRALFLALLFSLVLWNLPFGGLVLYPFKLFATWLHEMSHGLVMIVTGAGLSHLEIYRDTSGIAYARYGVNAPAQAAIASAGYMGTALFGATFLVLGQTARGARAILLVLAAALALSSAVVENDFGVASVLIGAGAFLALALIPGRRIPFLAVNFVAAQACVNAVLDIRVLFRSQLVINGVVARSSDAHNMARATFGNHWMWAAIWLLFSFAAFYAALRILYLRQRAASPIEAERPDEPAPSA